MANANGVYAVSLRKIINNSLDFVGSTVVKGGLLKTSHVPAFDTHDFLDDIPGPDRAKAFSGSGLKTLGAITSDISATVDKIFFSSALTTITFPSVTSGNKVGGLIIFKSSSAEATSPLICLCSFAASITAGGGTVTVTFNANGFMQASYQT